MIELPPPLRLRQRAADVGMTHPEAHQYRNRMGEPVYRDALANLLNSHYKINASRDNILGTSGVSGAIFSTLMTVKAQKKGEAVRVGLMVPFYTYHLRQINEALGQDPVFLPTLPHTFKPDWPLLDAKVSQGLDVLLVCNPGNPQGNVWTAEDMRRLVELTRQHNTVLLLDEIYCDLVWRGPFFSPSQEHIHEHVVICRGFAKTLGAQSWRCGYVISGASRVQAIMRVHDPIYISVPWLQHALADYLTHDYDDFVAHVQALGSLMQENWRKLSVALQDALGWSPVNPEGSMYGLFLHHMATDKDAVVHGLEAGVGVAPGNIFYPGIPENTGYVRIHCGISAQKADQIVAMLCAYKAQH